jgi:hypothetical protein
MALRRTRRTNPLFDDIEEQVLQMNEQARKLAEAAMATRRARRRERKSKNADRAGQTENAFF